VNFPTCRQWASQNARNSLANREPTLMLNVVCTRSSLCTICNHGIQSVTRQLHGVKRLPWVARKDRKGFKPYLSVHKSWPRSDGR